MLISVVDNAPTPKARNNEVTLPSTAFSTASGAATTQNIVTAKAR